jgi:hypothetical protein
MHTMHPNMAEGLAIVIFYTVYDSQLKQKKLTLTTMVQAYVQSHYNICVFIYKRFTQIKPA